MAVIALGTIVSVLVGCSGSGPRPGVEIGWPPAPQEPRIVYVGSIRGTADLSRSFWGSIKDFFFGKSEDMTIGKPYGLKQKGASKFYIADTAHKGIVMLDREAGVMKSFNSMGPYGRLLEPVYVLLTPDDDVLVSDTKLGRIAVFDREHRFQRFIGAEKDLDWPVGMALDTLRDELYVVDSKRHHIAVFDISSGTLLRTLGRRGDERGEFNTPTTIAFGPEAETLYVVDAFHFAVQAIDRDGKYLFSFGPTKVGVGTMARPRDIALDSDGNIYVTDALRNNVQMYDSSGNLLLRFGGMGLGPGQFRLPAGVTIDKDNYIYIADSINERIQIFKYLGKPQEVQ